jgi:acyl carrier protein
MEQIPPKVIDFINQTRAPLPPLTDPNEPLQIDSLGLTRLVLFLESDCGFRVEDEDLIPENFFNLRTLGALIARKSQEPETTS